MKMKSNIHLYTYEKNMAQPFFVKWNQSQLEGMQKKLYHIPFQSMSKGNLFQCYQVD